MSAPRNPFAYPKPITLDSLGDLFSHHRSLSGGWQMEGEGAAATAVVTEGDAGSSDKGDAGRSTWTPPSSQEELDKIINKAVGRVHGKYGGMTPEEAQQFKERAEALDFELSSETDKAARKAADEARAEERGKLAPSLVRQAFKAEAKGVLDKDQLDGLLEDFNPKNYLDDSGDVDEEKVAARVAKLAGKRDDKKQPPRPLGQGHQTAAAQSARDLGRAEAEKRFGKK